MSKKNKTHELMADIFQNSNKIEDELINVGSDRACVIVGAALLEDVLRALLAEYFTHKADSNKLFDHSGALGTFSAKIELSFHLGLISDYEYKLLNKIRDIRNRFAHRTCISSFQDDPSIKDEITAVLTINDKLWFRLKLVHADEALVKIPSDNPWKREYVKCILWLRLALYHRIIHARHTVPEPVLPFIDALDMQEFLCDSVESWINRCNIKMQDLREMRNLVLENNGNQETVSDIETNISLCEKQIKRSKEFLAIQQKFKKLTHEKMIEEGLLDNKQ